MLMCGLVTKENNALAQSVLDQSDSACDDTSVVLPFELPTVILAAHNGAKFDFAMILFECRRHGCKWEPSFADGLVVDTLPIVQSVVADLGGCAKLQCLVRGHCAELQAHRALDDCIALRNGRARGTAA